jgi:hypothetical protein
MTDQYADLDAALDRVIDAARAHLAAVKAAQGRIDDDDVWQAYVTLNNASFAYDEKLLDAYGEVTPWDVESIDPDEADERFGGGRYVRWDDGAEIRLGPRMLERADVDALVILEHERGHAARDLAAPRLYRLAVLGTFAFGLAIALGQASLVELGTLLMWAAYALALSHVLRDEAAASGYALDKIGQRQWPFSLRSEALVRLGVGLGIYLADWTAIAVVVALLTGALSCR